MIPEHLVNSLVRFSSVGESFASGVQGKCDRFAGSFFGDAPAAPVLASDELRFKDMLAEAAIFDRDLLARVRANPRWQWQVGRGLLRRLLGLRTRLVAVLAVDLDEVIARATPGAPEGDWPPLSAAALDVALRQVRQSPRRTFVGVCSASGFSDEAVELACRIGAQLESRGGGLVLVHPRDDGGWVARPLSGMEPSAAAAGQGWHFLFDPETPDDKIERVKRAIDAGGVDLAGKGLVDHELARRLEVPLEMVRSIFREQAERTPGLRLREFDGHFVLLGDAGIPERTTSMLGKLLDLFKRRGQEARKIEALSDQRAKLSGRRDKLYDDIDELGRREQDLKREGVAAESTVFQRRIASELGQVRRRIAEGNTLVGLLNRQIDILSTQIHHLTLVTQGQELEVPTEDELSREAARAEELLERVKVGSETAESLARQTGVSLTSGQEDEILAEFAAARKQEQAEQAQAEKDRNRPIPAEPVNPSQTNEPGRTREKPMRE